MSRTWFTSDQHFGHKNILLFEKDKRGKYDQNGVFHPYNSLDEMYEHLIQCWNEKVAQDDVVWFLGDLTLKHNITYINELVPRLNGIKKMIMGNHDSRKPEDYIAAGMKEVYKYPIILKRKFVLSHEPMSSMEDKNFFYIYGHVHSHKDWHDTSNSRCVCCDRHKMYPIMIPEFDKYIEEDAKF